MSAIAIAVVDIRGENSPASRNLLSAIGGTLTPGGAPAGTMHTLLEIYDSITGTFDSSAIIADENGSLIEILRYVEENMATGSGITSDSLDFDEFANNMTVDVPTTIDATAGLTFTRADVTGNFEVGGTASVSALTVGGVAYNPSLYLLLAGGTLTGDLFGTDAFFSQNLEVSGLASVSSLRVGGVAYNPGLYLPLTGGTLTGDLFGTEASFSSTFGSGLTDCDTAASSKILWNASTGRFSCGVDTGSAGGSGGTLGVNALGGTFQPTSSLSFSASDFNVSYTTPQSIVRLDWVNGPASRSADQNISGSWTFSNSTTGFTVTNDAAVLGELTVGSLTAPLINGDTLVSGNLDVAGRVLSTYASASVAIEAGTVKADTITNSTGTLTINAFTLGGNVTGNARNITGIGFLGASTINAFSLGGDITGAGFNITGINRFSTAAGSASGTFEAALIKATTISSDTGTVTFSGSATTSSNFEAKGYASASAFFGAGLINCNGAAQKLLYSGGLFSCGVDQSGSGGGAVGIRSDGDTFSNVTSISFDASDFDVTFPLGAEGLVALDWINGPASRAANQTITGFWRFTAASTQFSTIEVSNTASISGIVVDHGYLRMTNGSASSTFEAATIKATSIGGGGVLTINPTTRTQITGNASVSANIEAAGYASSSRFFGAGLADCDVTQKLQWSSGFFTCVTDEIGSGGNVIGLREGAAAFTNISSVTFDASMFDISFPDQGLVRLDWLNGPASRAAVNTWTALNSFTGGVSVSANFEVVGSRRVGINAGNVTNSTLEVGGTASISGTTTLSGVTYTWPSAQASGILQNNGSGILSWAAGRLVTSDSLDFDELEDVLSLDADTTIANDGFSLTIEQLRITDSLRIAGFASASAYFGSALPNCTGAGEKLLYDSSTGQFSCALDQSGTGGGGGGVLGIRESGGTYVNKSSISFDAGQFDVSYPDEALIELDWGLSGPASRALANRWEGLANFVAGASTSTLFGAGLTNCTNPTGDKLLWNSATGEFSCASDQQGASSAGGWTDDGTTVRLSAASDNVGIGTATADGKFVIRQDAAADSFNVMDAATNVFTIIDGGNVGIGDTTPEARLKIVGVAGNNQLLAIASATGVEALSVQKNNDVILNETDVGNVAIGTGVATQATLTINALGSTGNVQGTTEFLIEQSNGLDQFTVFGNGDILGAGEASISGAYEGGNSYLSGLGTTLRFTVGVANSSAPANTTAVIRSATSNNGSIKDLDIQNSNGTYNFTVFNDGNASLSSNFEVEGQIKVPNGSAVSPGYAWSTYPSTGFYIPSANVIGITTAGTEAMRLDASGNVAIGTVTTTTAKFQIRGTAGPDPIMVISSSSGTAIFQVGKKGTICVGHTCALANYSRFGSSAAVPTNASIINDQNDLYVLGGMEIEDKVFFEDTASVSGNFEVAGATTLNTVRYTWPASQGVANSYLKNDGSGLLTWSVITGKVITSNSLDFDEFANAMTLDATTTVAQGAFNYGFTGTGNVGVGIAAPVIKLHVFSTADTDILRLEDLDGTCSHNPEAGSEVVTCSSDERLKTTIVDTPSALSFLSGFRIRNYTIRTTGDRVTGVIAQELLQTRPDEVSSTSRGFLSVQQPNPWVLVKAIQELDIKVASLSAGRSLNFGVPESTEALQARLVGSFRATLGISMETGIVRVDRVRAKGMELEGDDGEIYCVRIVDGDMVSNQGECTHAIATTTSPVTPRQTSTPTPTVSVTPTTSAMPTTAVSPTASSEPSPSATISSSPVASASESPTPETSAAETLPPEATESETPAPGDVVPELPETGLPAVVKNHPLYVVIAIVIFGFITALFLKKKLRNDA